MMRTSRFIVCLLVWCMSSAVAQDEGGSKPLRAAIKRYEDAQKKNTRLIGGKSTTIERNPWQVALLYSRDDDRERAQFCGGVVVHPRWVLTAAHCIDGGTKPAQVHILSGTANLRAGKGLRSPTDEVIHHRQWSRSTDDFDIGLIKVSQPLLGKVIAPASDATINALSSESKVWVSGWGVTDLRRAKSTYRLQGVELDFIDRKTCNKFESYNGRLTQNMFCAGILGPEGGGGKDACYGDSGGPLSIHSGAKARLVGLVSWGVDCAEAYKYGVYTQVSRFRAWVREVTVGEVAW